MNTVGYKEEFLKWFFGDLFPVFSRWMYGQTTAQIDGVETYYVIDVYNFCDRYNLIRPQVWNIEEWQNSYNSNTLVDFEI